jgi:hypothetical protein
MIVVLGSIREDAKVDKAGTARFKNVKRIT